jgi:hypothetical protein
VGGEGMSHEIEFQAAGVSITAFFGKSKHQVETALDMFAKSHTVVRTEYEYDSDLPRLMQHTIWVIYRK